MRVSEHFGLKRHQGELDFVDVDVVGDVRLFVDPRALRLLPTEWGKECVSLVQNYFRTVLGEIKKGNDQTAIRLLSGLTEPNETHLGLSTAHARGTGLGPGLARDTWEALSQSNAAQSGLLVDLEDTALLVEGISRDRVSDITTNIIREPLIAYTQDVARYYGIPLKQGVVSGALWNPQRHEWWVDHVELPMGPRGRIILVPKAIVRRKLDFDQNEYYTHFVLPFMEQVELSANSGLVDLLKNGNRRVLRKKQRKSYGQGKDTLVRLSRQYPEILKQYKKAKKKDPRPPLDHPDIAGQVGGSDSAPDFAALLTDLKAIPTGKVAAEDYHRAVERLLTALFYPALSNPDIEYEIHQGRKRIDIAYTNVATDGFFNWVGKHYTAPSIFVECKNYKGDLANAELDQLGGRFGPSRGEVGLLVCRSFKDKDRFLQRCRDTAQDQRGYIVVLDDDDLAELVEARGPLVGEGEFKPLLDRFRALT
jgi:hypothetical protein